MAQSIRWKRSARGVLAAAFLLAAGLASISHAGLFDDIFKKSPAETAKAAGVIKTADQVKIPLKIFDSGKALFLVHPHEGRDLFSFAMRSSDGVYRAAFDTCDVCFRANRGYRQEGDLMVCKQCRQAFPSVKINEVRGGCNPAPLSRKVEGQFLVIQKADLAAGKDYFILIRS